MVQPTRPTNPFGGVNAEAVMQNFMQAIANAATQGHAQQDGLTSVVEHFRWMYPQSFEGSSNPLLVEDWIWEIKGFSL